MPHARRRTPRARRAAAVRSGAASDCSDTASDEPLNPQGGFDEYVAPGTLEMVPVPAGPPPVAAPPENKAPENGRSLV